MSERTKTFGLGLFSLIIFVSAPVLAANSHQGKGVQARTGELTMTSMTGDNQHTHDVTADTKVTCEGEPCSLESLGAGDVITVIVDQKDGKSVVTEIQKTKGGMRPPQGSCTH